MMQRPRGDNQQRILDYIKAEINDKGYPPSVREIADAVGLKSTSTVHGHLKRLEKKGLLHRDTMKPRALEVTGDPSFVRSSTTAVPVVGVLHPGKDILSEENLEDFVPLPDVLLGNGEHFILRVQSERMKNDGIIRGDYAVVRMHSLPGDGDFAVALINDSLVIGRCRRAADATISLQFSDGTSPAVYPTARQMVGEVVSLFRMIK